MRENLQSNHENDLGRQLFQGAQGRGRGKAVLGDGSMFFLFVSFHGCEKGDVRSLEKIETGDEECGIKLATGLKGIKNRDLLGIG